MANKSIIFLVLEELVSMSSLQWSSDSAIGRLAKVSLEQMVHADAGGSIEAFFLQLADSQLTNTSTDLATDLEIIFRKKIQDVFTSNQVSYLFMIIHGLRLIRGVL
jgi:hypothetical protein